MPINKNSSTDVFKNSLKEGLQRHVEDNTGVIGEMLRAKRERAEQEQKTSEQVNEINAVTAKIKDGGASLTRTERSFVQISKNLQIIAKAMGAEVTLSKLAESTNNTQKQKQQNNIAPQNLSGNNEKEDTADNSLLEQIGRLLPDFKKKLPKPGKTPPKTPGKTPPKTPPGKTKKIVTASKAAIEKVAKKILQKAFVKLAVKSIPFVGIAAGAMFAVDALLKGDLTTAGLEITGSLLGPVTAIPLSVASAITETYFEMYETDFATDALTDPEGAQERLEGVKMIVEQTARMLLTDRVVEKQPDQNKYLPGVSSVKPAEALDLLRNTKMTEKDLDGFGGRAKLERIAGFTTEEARGNSGDSAEQVHRDERMQLQPVPPDPRESPHTGQGATPQQPTPVPTPTPAPPMERRQLDVPNAQGPVPATPPPAPAPTPLPPPVPPLPLPTPPAPPPAPTPTPPMERRRLDVPNAQAPVPVAKPQPSSAFTAPKVETDDSWTMTRIKKSEGLMLQAYIDRENWAIGYGFNLINPQGKPYKVADFPTKEKLAAQFATDGSKYKTVITEKEASELLARSFSNAKKEAEKLSYWKYANAYGQSALIEIMYNIGPSKFKKFTKAQKLLEQGKFWLGAIEMWDSVWARKGEGGIGPSRAAEILNLLAVGSTIDSAFRTEPLPWMQGKGRNESNRVSSSAGSGAEINAGSNAIADATAKQNLVPDTQVIRIAKNQINYKSVDSANRFETATYVGA